MNAKLKEVPLNVDLIIRNPAAAARAQLERRKMERELMAIEEMTDDQLYDQLDSLTLYRQKHGRGKTPEAAQARHYCKKMRAKVKRRLKRLGLPTTRPGDKRTYGPGQAKFQQAGG